MRKIWIIVIIVVVLGVAIAFRVGLSNRGPQKQEENKIIPVEVLRITRSDVTSTCEVIGILNAVKTAQVFPEAMGRITSILVKEGTYVNKNSRIMAFRNETVGFEYEQGYITAPISGNVANIMVTVGSMVTPQMPVAVVVEFSRVEAVFNMSENALDCIKKGNKVQVAVDALPGLVFSGTISEVSPVIDPMTRTVSARAIISNSKKLLKPGMTARVILTIGAQKNVIAVPKEALLDSYVFVVEDSTAQRRDVVVGLVGDRLVEIKDGVNEDEQIVVVGQQRLAGGEKVNPIPGSE